MTTQKKKAETKSGGTAHTPSATMPLNAEAMQAWQDLMTEWGRFVTDRLHHDIEAQRAMLECKTPSDLMRVQTEFFQTAVKQYSEETMRMMQMMSDATSQTMAGATAIAKRKYDDVPL